MMSGLLTLPAVGRRQAGINGDESWNFNQPSSSFFSPRNVPVAKIFWKRADKDFVRIVFRRSAGSNLHSVPPAEFPLPLRRSKTILAVLV